MQVSEWVAAKVAIRCTHKLLSTFFSICHLHKKYILMIMAKKKINPLTMRLYNMNRGMMVTQFLDRYLISK